MRQLVKLYCKDKQAGFEDNSFIIFNVNATTYVCVVLAIVARTAVGDTGCVRRAPGQRARGPFSYYTGGTHCIKSFVPVFRKKV
jgi:hypothetical protein